MYIKHCLDIHTEAMLSSFYLVSSRKLCTFVEILKSKHDTQHVSASGQIDLL